MPITIRHARTDDIAAMAGLLGQLFAIEADFSVNEQAQMRGLSLLLRAAACLLVADEDGVVVGMVSIQTLISTAEGGAAGLLEDLVVAEGCRGRGIGTRLLHAALAWVREQGLTRVQLLADTNNEEALRFYSSHGFQKTQLVCLRISHSSAPAVAYQEHTMNKTILDERKSQVHRIGEEPFAMACDRPSLAGAVSQRACVFCGSRVVLYPIADALHLVHGPIGCATYTWDIRGAISSGPQLHRLSFSTDLQEMDVIFGGEKKLEASLRELIGLHSPKAAFVYSTCIVGLIGDDMEAVCRRVAADTGIPVLPVMSEGFKGNKREGYTAACKAMFRLVGTGDTTGISPMSVNILGDFNLAGETWIVREYFRKMGVEVVANITGDGRVDDIRRCHGAALNLVQCSGATMELAKMMQEKYGTPFHRVSYLGVEDMADSLYKVADFFAEQDPSIKAKTVELVRAELSDLMPKLAELRRDLEGKKVAMYVGGSFKAFSLIKAFRHLGMRVVVVGSQTGTEEDYRELAEISDPGTIIVDDANPLELAQFIKEKDVDVFVGGVKERPIAYKLGVGFCDHNHERKIALEGFVGMYNFAREIHASVMSPVWRFMPRRSPARAACAAKEAVNG